MEILSLDDQTLEWFSFAGSIASIFGLFVTCFLLWEARKIRTSFLRRARLPEIIKDLSVANSKISKHLKSWDEESREGTHQLLIAKELIASLKPKLPDVEKKKCSAYIQKLTPKKWFFFYADDLKINEKKAWDLYSNLSGLITTLEQLQKDSRWD